MKIPDETPVIVKDLFKAGETVEGAIRKSVDFFTAADAASTPSQTTAKAKIESPRLEAELLLSHVLGITRTQVVINKDRALTGDELREFEGLVRQKQTGAPTAYLLGDAEFYGRKFFVDKAVLIPRPETEELVEWIVNSFNESLNEPGPQSSSQGEPEYDKKNGGLKILDLCTGSGCIGLTLACELPAALVCLADLSEEALGVARRNASEIMAGFLGNCLGNPVNHLMSNSMNNPVNHPGVEKEHTGAKPPIIDILRSDLFTDITPDDFQLIVSNPPYVTADEFEYLDAGVKNFEPRQALLVDDPGKFNRALISGAFARLQPGGWLYLETSPTLIGSIAQLLAEAGFTRIEVKKDLSGKDRFIRGCK